MKRFVLLGTATVLAVASMATTAYASIGISSFSLTPSTTQAGAQPDLHINTTFNSSGTDSVNNATLSLAPGLLANPTVAQQCGPIQFTLNLCPSGSWIGTGTVTGNVPVPFVGFNLPLPANLFMVAPGNSGVARIGLIVNIFGIPFESALAPVNVRTLLGNTGLDIDFAGLPNSWNGLPLVIDGMNLTIFGKVNGQQFTRNPTSCAPATSRLAAISYQNASATPTASSTFTPTGCSSLGYSPSITAAAALDPSDAGVSYTTVIKQNVNDAETKTISVTTPPSLSPSIQAAANGCTATDLTTCPAIGSATATTPFLSQPLTGKIVLISHSGALPTPSIVFTSPVALTINGTDTLGGSPLALTATFDNLPDIPLTNLTVTFNGGQGSLFLAHASALCTPPQPTVATGTSWGGQSGTVTVPTAVTGCPSASPATSTTTATAASVTSARQKSATTATRSTKHTKVRRHKQRKRHIRRHASGRK